ncbi:EAL domain-containing protein [Aurantiacibacter luteus]|nr:EAL domain-containing protein [Aurantiacibacter luteus]
MRYQRTRHALAAGAIALVVYLLTLMQPVDQLIWIAQSRAGQTAASGDIVYVGSRQDLADPRYPERRRALAELVGRLDSAGAKAIYVDAAFDLPSTPEADAALNRALRAAPGRTFLVSKVVTALDGTEQLDRSIHVVAQGVQEVGTKSRQNYLGYVWSQTFSVTDAGIRLPSTSASMAGVRGNSAAQFPISYNFDLSTIPALEFDELDSGNATDLASLAGKTVIVGDFVQSGGANIPGQIAMPWSYVDIYAAETLMAGRTKLVYPLVSLAIVLVALLGATLLPRRRRTLAYFGIVVAIPVALNIAAQLGVRVYGADALAMLAIFALFRLRARWAAKFQLVDAETGLPTLAALENDGEVAETVPAIVVARIHRFEEVRRSLPRDLHAEYLLRITGRLKAATRDARIYLGQGHMMVWTLAEKDPALLREHLEGLRALFSSPLIVGDQQVDVGITFGVDISPSPNVARRVASAVAVAETTNETYEPIAIADTASEEDLIWNISLQARIDAALASNEIYLAFQPKVLIQSGEIVGVEALVRWNDPERGQIPPDNFIRQCETAGRMSQLTRYVLEKGCLAGNAFDEAGLSIPVAVNISATLIHERQIVDMVAEVLDQTGFEPRHLTLEITETYRISNLDLAAGVLHELAALGCKISMDDFGVGAASLEALLRLPFDELKIDRAFISQMLVNTKAEAIVKSILAMGKTMRIVVIAEGVEDTGTLTKLRESGCIVAQGFGISRPVDFETILRNHNLGHSEALRNMV